MSENYKKEHWVYEHRNKAAFPSSKLELLDLSSYDLSLENGLFQMAKQKKLRKQMN